MLTQLKELYSLLTNEQLELTKVVWTPYLLSVVAASCVVSVSISYAGWNCRKLISASCFAVLGRRAAAITHRITRT